MYCLSQEIDGLLNTIRHCDGRWNFAPFELSKIPKERRETRQRVYEKKKAQHEAELSRLYAQLEAYQHEYQEMQRRFESAQILLTLSEVPIQCKAANISPTAFMNAGTEPQLKH